MFNKGNMAKMLKQAQEVQKQIENVQNELDDLNIEGESGGGMVKATVNGKMELLDLSPVSYTHLTLPTKRIV